MRDGLFSAKLTLHSKEDSAVRRVFSSAPPREEKASATIYFVKPMYKPDAIIRPLDYNFNVEFIDDLVDNVNSIRKDFVKNKTGFGFNPDKFGLRLSQSTKESIMPSSMTYRYGRRGINDLYRFVLVLRNCPSTSRMRLHNPKNQVIYTGWCLDEPISRTGHFNLDCELVFTHLTHTEIVERIDHGGYQRDISTCADCDILDKRTSEIDSNRESDRDFLIGPDHILESIQGSNSEEYDEYESITNPTIASLSRQSRAKTTRSIFNSPHRQINRLFTGLSKAMIHKYTDTYHGVDDYPGSPRSYLSFNDSFANRRMLTEAMNEEMASKISGPQYYKQQLTLRSLLSVYPNLEDYAQILDVEGGAYDNILNEENSDIFSIISSYFKTAIPPVMSDYGLAYIAFRYATSDPRQRFISRRDRDCELDVLGADPFLDEPKEDTEEKANRAIQYLRDHVFSVAEEMAGELELFCEYSSGNDTIIHLQLREQTDVINNDIVIHHGDLGGLSSPQVGSMDQFENGNRLITSVLNILDDETGYMSDGTGYGSNLNIPFREDEKSGGLPLIDVTNLGKDGRR